ncbi:putative phospholipase B-like 2 [Panonychus citri]|uniref:putative phospholipase B-like 2 n=1 Tax=Panonychus citri TaxID=50023 RepID=UPI00230820AB|nr:putative phospholipase B-like 2 [Panonychus citri]
MLIKLIFLTFCLIKLIKSDEICIDLANDQKISVSSIAKEDWLTSSYPVCASFSNQINKTGWAKLHVWTQSQSNYNDSTLAYLAGYIEGYLTKDLINMHYDNLWEKYCNGEMAFCRRAFDFFAQNEAYIEREAIANRDTDPYWNQVGLILDQLTGMEEAINSRSSYHPGYRVNTTGKVYLVNTVADIMDLESALNRTVKTLAVGQSFCSSLVRYTGNDLLIGHNTWTQFGYMLRVLKKYEFNFKTTSSAGKLVPGSMISMSSYPGIIFSIDDFYLISSGLAVAETTNGNHNATSFDLLRPTNCVLTMIRTMVANRLARDGKSWAKNFEKFNSGTYNNQFIVVDYNKFQPGSTKRPTDLLWIIEQMPGSVVYDDMSSTLITNGYWASYNIPYFQKTYHIAGYPQLVNKYGDFYIHELNPRAKLFRRKHIEAFDHKSLLQLLRYNNYTQDPESKCNCTPPYSASMSLACRGDLNDPSGIYAIPSQGVINEAAIDTKVTSFELFNKLKMFAISGPTYDNVPPFSWSNFTLRDQLVHKGHPDLWIFKPIYFPDN